MSETFELRIDSIAAGGDGVGRHEGMVVFVPRTGPGDVVRVVAERDGRLMRGTVADIVTRSQDRVVPDCRHYEQDRCGGCQVQHLSYEGQLKAKAGIIHDSLTRIGARTIEKPLVQASPSPWRYRAKLTLALRFRSGAWIAGMHPHDAPGAVFALDDCLITDAAVVAHWKAVMAASRWLPHANELRASVRLVDSGFALVVEGARAWTTHRELFQAVPTMQELWWQADGRRRKCVQSRAHGQAGASFTQVNAPVAARLRACVLDIVRPLLPTNAVDAYSGTGDLAVGIAALGANVTAIEIDRDASRVCAMRLPAGSKAVAAAVESALPSALPADVVVLNPPRAGLDARIPAILQSESEKPRAVVYVSCNPATLARDLKRLDRYRIQSLHAFDMFPQTAHVETVCELVPAA